MPMPLSPLIREFIQNARKMYQQAETNRGIREYLQQQGINPDLPEAQPLIKLCQDTVTKVDSLIDRLKACGFTGDFPTLEPVPGGYICKANGITSRAMKEPMFALEDCVYLNEKSKPQPRPQKKRP